MNGSSRARFVRTATLASTALLVSAAPTFAGSTPANSDPVARISTVAPNLDFFVIEATLPVPPRVVLPGQATVPLALATRDGNEMTSQVEIVSRYPNPGHGADVIEIMARVERPANVQPGDELTFDVVRSSQPVQPYLATVPIRTLLATPGAIRLTANDLNGNGYDADLLTNIRIDHPAVTMQRDGALCREWRSHEIMALDTGSVQGESYDHLLGAHVFARTYANEDFMILDLVLHNGMVDPSGTPSELDNTVDKLYFDTLNLHLPDGWRVGWTIDTAYDGATQSTANGTVTPLLDRLPNGQFHVVPQRSQFVRRLVIAQTSQALARGRRVLRRETRAFCVPGPTPDQASPDPADDLWSWWNEATARFQVVNHRLPHLDHISGGQIRGPIVAKYQDFSDQTSTGNEGGYPTFSHALGWAQPWGVKYGGMTGGDEIEMFPNIAEAWLRDPVALRLMDLKSKAYIDRQPIAMFNRDGRAPRLEEHVIGSGPNAYVPFYFNLVPSSGGDYWGFQGVDRSFQEIAYLTARLPFYEKDLEDYKPIDFQHYTRFLNPLLGLVWLANDSVAKLELELSACCFQFSFHPYFNSNYGHVQGTGLKQRVEDISLNPGQGADFGRGTAWGLVASTAFYAIADDADRDRMVPWFELTAVTARAGQSTCTGNTTARQINKEFKGAYQSRQSFEASYFLSACEGVRSTVFENFRGHIEQQLQDLVVDAAYSSVQAPFWSDAAGGQYRILAVRPRSMTLPEFCQNIPDEGYLENPYFDSTTGFAPWAYAYPETNDMLFLLRGSEASGAAGNTLATLESWGLAELPRTAPFIAMLQSL